MVTPNFFVVLNEILGKISTAAASPLPNIDGNNNSSIPNMKQNQPLAQNLPPVIVIDQPQIEMIIELIQQQPFQQLQQQLQQPNLDPIAYAPIAKLEKFTGEEDDTQIWLHNVEKTIIANG
ncbi:hypothetical protein G9A89_022533 [Geosiphon pyriformis]|nr:hypothetical protein G9A89_022533 [Geosiphon pyriformis]